ncbi:kinesin protein KIF15, partial [Biomphalaria glabrata]
PSENLESSWCDSQKFGHGSKKQFLCRCSFLEIYQEQILDLLDTASQGICLRENMNKGVFVDGLIEQVICNPKDAYQLIIKGWLNRRVALTSMNREGSRSHAVFTVKIESKEEVLSPLDDK